MNDNLDYRGRPRVQTVFEDESLTVQSDRDGADVNKILDRYAKGGTLDSLNQADLRFLDVSEIGDYAEVMRTAKTAEVEFMKLPSKIREQFGHDVGNWLDAAHDQEKRNAMVEAGLIKNPADDPEEGSIGDIGSGGSGIVDPSEEGGTPSDGG